MTSKQEFYKKKHDSIGGGGRKKVPYVKLKEGETTIRILPPFNPAKPGEYPAWNSEDEGTWFFREYRKVNRLGPNKRTIIPRYQFGDEACPYKAWADSLKKQAADGNAVAQAELDGVQEQDRVGMWVIIRGEEEKGPQYWETTQNNLKMIMAIALDDEYGDIDRAHPDQDGRGAIDLKIVYNKQETPAKMYRISPKRNSSPLGTEEQVKLWTSKNLWEEYGAASPADADYIKAVIEGTEQQRNDGHEPDAPANIAPPPPDVPPPAPPAPQKIVVLPDGNNADTKWWAFVNGSVTSTTAAQIAAALEVGEDLKIAPTGSSNPTWNTATSYGFKLDIPAAPPSPPAAPPAAPPAPPPDAQHPVPPSEVETLKAQVEALKQQTAAVGSSDLDEIEKLLGDSGSK